MSKKLMMCLLSLSVILSGCVQEEQPEEPPVVDEESDQLPDSNKKNGDEFTEKNPIENKPDENPVINKLSLYPESKNLNKMYELAEYIPNLNQIIFAGDIFNESIGKINENNDYVYISDERTDRNGFIEDDTAVSSNYSYNFNTKR